MPIMQENVLNKDMLMISTVREKMRRQWDEDVQRSKLAKRVCLRAGRIDDQITLLKKDCHSRQSFINDLQDDARAVNRRLEALLARDIMELPEEAIQAAKRKFNPYDISNL